MEVEITKEEMILIIDMCYDRIDEINQEFPVDTDETPVASTCLVRQEKKVRALIDRLSPMCNYSEVNK